MTLTWVGAAALALALAMGIFLLYFLAYPIRHLTLPVGFDPPWYVWRAEHLTGLGVGNGDLAARPGYPVLSAVLGSVTGLSQLEMTVILSVVLVCLLALAVGALARGGLGLDRRQWAVVVAATGVVLGPTHLVGENLSNALNIALEVGAMVALAASVGRGRGMAGAVLLLVASGLAHWDFVALFMVVMGAAFLMALPSSMHEREKGMPASRTESGALAVLAAWAGGILLVIVAAVLRAPFRTIEIGNDELLFRRKFRTDVARLTVPGVAGLVGPWVLPIFFRRSGTETGPKRVERTSSQRALDGIPEWRGRAFSLRLLRAWTYVMAAGMVLGLLTFAVPPARFLAHLVALPGAITVGVAVLAVAEWVRRRSVGPTRWGGLVTFGVIAAILAALAVPGILRWYRYPVLLDPAAVREARTADQYVRELPAHQPIVFLVDYGGRPGSLSPTLKERTIRMGLSPDRQVDAHIFVGSLPDLLAGRRTPAPDARTERLNRRYWEDVRPFLAARPPVVILEAMARIGYEQAVAMGAARVAPSVAVLRGPPVTVELPAAPAPKEVPSLPAGLWWGLAVLALLSALGAGWTRALFGSGHAPETMVAMAPVVGAGVLMLGGLAAAELGVRLGGVTGVTVYVVLAAAGAAVAVLDIRRRPSTESS
jgi:hypothetical protein